MHSLESGINELIKGYQMLKNSLYGNIWIILNNYSSRLFGLIKLSIYTKRF
jgi:hypothetical protein